MNYFRTMDPTYIDSVDFYKEILIFDTETTGLRSDDQIIQFSGIYYSIDDSGEMTIKDMMDVYINPGRPLDAKITEITGITDEMLKDAPCEEEMGPKILEFLAQSKLWAAYNAPFDLRMLRQMCGRLDLFMRERETLDVLKMARDCVPRDDVDNFKLATVTNYLFPDQEIQFHSSIEDVKATGLCFEQFLVAYRKYEPEPKVPVKLNWAGYWENPRRLSQKRIKLNITEGEYGDIFWDVIKKSWSCKSTGSAKRIFNTIDMEDLERQVLRRYGDKYQAYDMEDLAKSWGCAKR